MLIHAMIQVSELNKLNAIHVAGTKGKGSTSAIGESILNKLQIVENGVARPLKTGRSISGR